MTAFGEDREGEKALASVKRVLVYPAFNARYYSMYLLGLYRAVGRSRLAFTANGFPDFESDCLAMRVLYSDAAFESRIYIHANDYPDLDPAGLAWCDVFGKVNLDPGLLTADMESSVVPLGPTFAVRVWGPLQAELMGVANFLRKPRACGSFRAHLANYRGQYASRFPESAYRPTSVRSSDYVFYNAAIWEREPEANALRARFVEACRSLDHIRFEGGLSPRHSARGDRDFSAEEYESYFSRRYDPREYLERTRESVVVLNNPAYVDCHSWRLAEYLAMGKAIISTPIVRALPAPLVDGIHVHHVDGSIDSFRAAVSAISKNEEYRKHLERNARAYYERYLAPVRVVRRLLAQSGRVPEEPLAST